MRISATCRFLVFSLLGLLTSCKTSVPNFSALAHTNAELLSASHTTQDLPIPDLGSPDYKILTQRIFLRRLADYSTAANFSNFNASQIYRFSPCDANGYGVVFIGEAYPDIDFFRKYSGEGTVLKHNLMLSDSNGYFKPYRYESENRIIVFSGDATGRFSISGRHSHRKCPKDADEYFDLDAKIFRMSNVSSDFATLTKVSSKYSRSLDWMPGSEYSMQALKFAPDNTLAAFDFLDAFLKNLLVYGADDQLPDIPLRVARVLYHTKSDPDSLNGWIFLPESNYRKLKLLSPDKRMPVKSYTYQDTLDQVKDNKYQNKGASQIQRYISSGGSTKYNNTPDSKTSKKRIPVPIPVDTVQKLDIIQLAYLRRDMPRFSDNNNRYVKGEVVNYARLGQKWNIIEAVSLEGKYRWLHICRKPL